MPFRKSYTLVGVLDSGKSEGKVEVMTELAEKEVADAWMRGGGGGGIIFLILKIDICGGRGRNKMVFFKKNKWEKKKDPP